MKILYIADGRSPTAINWIDYFVQARHEVHLVSTFLCEAVPGVASMTVIPAPLSRLYSRTDQTSGTKGGFLRRYLPVDLRTRIRQITAPLSFPYLAGRLQAVIERIRPDLIHAMRIPYEGMIAVEALKELRKNSYQPKYPLLISVWGNDFTLHANSTTPMQSHTRQALEAADGLHTDCQRDLRLAMDMGFEATKPAIVLPGGGGVKMDIFHPHEHKRDEEEAVNGQVTIINPRGMRAYVRNDTVFNAVRLAVEKYPDLHLVCPGMSDEAQALRWATQFCITEKAELLPNQSQHQMAKLFRHAQITLSITTHDGTPNTLLEAMACGCFPIAGDIESIREWITHGENGLLVDPGDPDALAKAILEAIEHPKLRKQARDRNLEMVKARGEHEKCMTAAEEFYSRLITQKI